MQTPLKKERLCPGQWIKPRTLSCEAGEQEPSTSLFSSVHLIVFTLFTLFLSPLLLLLLAQISEISADIYTFDLPLQHKSNPTSIFMLIFKQRESHPSLSVRALYTLIFRFKCMSY